jgi:hypothetical protein
MLTPRYGGLKEKSDDVAVSLSKQQIVPGQGLSQTFNLITVAGIYLDLYIIGAYVSFTDFDQFRLFELTSQSMIASADLPPPGTGIGTIGSTIGSTNSTTGSPSPPSTSSSALLSISSGLIAFLLAASL